MTPSPWEGAPVAGTPAKSAEKERNHTTNVVPIPSKSANYVQSLSVVVTVQGGASGRTVGWVDSELGSSPDWWAATVATYCPSRMVEHPKSKSTLPNCRTRCPTLYKTFMLWRNFLFKSLQTVFRDQIDHPVDCEQPALKPPPLHPVVPGVHPVRAGGGIDALPHAEPAPPHQQGAPQLHRVAVKRHGALQVGTVTHRVTHLVANLGWVDFDLGCSTILLGQ